MMDSQKIPREVGRAVLDHPVEGEKLIRLEDIREELRRQSLAIFGDPSLEITGLVGDVKFLKIHFWRAIWTLSGGMAVGGFFISGAIVLVGFWLEYRKP